MQVPKSKDNYFWTSLILSEESSGCSRTALALVCICLYLCGRDIWICPSLGLQEQVNKKADFIYLILFSIQRIFYTIALLVKM